MDTKQTEHVRALAREHSRAEDVRDLAATMATLVAEPVYEFQPTGRIMRGRELVEAYYEHLFTRFIPCAVGARTIDAWCNETSFAEEYDIDLRIDDRVERHRVLGIVLVSGDRISGERIWGSERVLRLMMGDEIYDRLD